jgi:predicted metal-binding membrane protein
MNALAGRRPFFLVMGGLIVLAWLVLWVWEQSPYGRYLDHGQWGEPRLAELAERIPALADFATYCGRILTDNDALVSALLYIAGWTLMIVAMMLPTTLPLLEVFRRVTAARPERAQLMGLLVAGYLGAWITFGVVAHLADFALYRLTANNPWLAANGWSVGAGTLLLAGAFQFSRLKYACLDKCRTPFSFVMSHWQGRAERRQAFLLGAHHGLFCVGCCWALMLLMFGVGIGNVGWMLVLGAVMAVEKNMPWGRRIAAPLGVVLIASGLVIPALRLWHGGP